MYIKNAQRVSKKYSIFIREMFSVYKNKKTQNMKITKKTEK